MSRHLDNAILRRYLDEPDALLAYEKEHLLQCTRCRAELERLRENAEIAGRALSQDVSRADFERARAAVIEKSASVQPPLDARPARPNPFVRVWRWQTAAAAAIVFALLLSYAPFRAYAQSLLTIFEPQTITPISVTTADLKNAHNIPALRELGTVKTETHEKERTLSTLADAQRFAKINALHPAYLPAAVSGSVKYVVSPPASMAFTFDARKARASAARRHLAIPSPPPGVDGSTLTASSGAVVVAYYGEPKKPSRKHPEEFPRNGLVVMQGTVPIVRSTGDAREIEAYLLSLPNVPDDIKAQIRAIQNPDSTLPFPVAVDRNTAQPVTVHGAQGLLVGDNTGIGSMVVWFSGGKFYSVAGGFSSDEIKKVADSMEP